jgi:DNA-binding NarL/FixJ family response regulator
MGSSVGNSPSAIACASVVVALAMIPLIFSDGHPLLSMHNLACLALVAASVAGAISRLRADSDRRRRAIAGLKTLSLLDRGLTCREREIVLDFLAGKSMKAISIERRISNSTVRNTLSSVYKKLSVSGSAELYALGARYRVE